MNTVRLAIVVSHPIQHFVHFYRALAHEADIDLVVIFATRKGLDAYFDSEMNTTLSWSGDLLSGYRHVFLDGAEKRTSLGSALTQFQPDAVLTYGYATALSLRAIAWARTHRIAVMMIGDSDNVRQRVTAKAIARRWLLRALFSQIDAFLTVGDQNEAALRSCGVPRERMFRSPFTIDEDLYRDVSAHRSELRRDVRARYGISNAAFVVLLVGKLSKRKRPGDLVEAVARLNREGGERKVHALMCGNGEEFEALKRRVDAEQLPVAFAGFVNVDALPSHYAAADILVHPSEHDPHPLVCSEAAAVGLPLVLSDKVGAIGPTDIARDGENIIVYRCGDVSALSAAIYRLLHDPSEVSRLSQNSRQIFEQCSMDDSVAGLKCALAATVPHRRR